MTAKDLTHDRHFDRRLKAAKAGLASSERGRTAARHDFFRDELSEDIREYADRLSRRIRKRGDLALAALAASLDELIRMGSTLRSGKRSPTGADPQPSPCRGSGR